MKTLVTHILQRTAVIMVVVACSLTTWAQEDKRVIASDDVYTQQPDKQVVVSTPTVEPVVPQLPAPVDTLRLPPLSDVGRVAGMGFYPYLYGMGWDSWRLHEGLNLSLGASIFSQFGKHAYGGVGFAQNLSAVYAVSLSPKLSMAVGGYLDNVCWANSTYRDAGLTAVVGYRFDERWEGYLYGQKTVLTNMPVPLYLQDLNDMGDRIGAAVRYNFNPNFSIQMSVERRRFDQSPVFVTH